MPKKLDKNRKRFKLEGAKEQPKPKPKNPIPDPPPDPPPGGPPEEPTANILELPTRTANRAYRNNKRWAQKNGEDHRKTDPFVPKVVPLDKSSGEFKPDLNDLTAYMIGNMVANGSSNKFAAPMAGIPSGTMSSWLTLGRRRRDEISEWLGRAAQMLEDGKSSEEIDHALGECGTVDKYVRFANRMELCEAEKHNNLFMVVWRSAVEEEEVTSAMWLLEKLFAKQYGKNASQIALQNMPLREADKGQDDNVEGDPTQELQRRIVELVERRRTQNGS